MKSAATGLLLLLSTIAGGGKRIFIPVPEPPFRNDAIVASVRPSFKQCIWFGSLCRRRHHIPPSPKQTTTITAEGGPGKQLCTN